MAGPSPAFLAQLNAGLGAAPPAGTPPPDPFAAGLAQLGAAPPPVSNEPPLRSGDATLYSPASVGGPPIQIPGVSPPPTAEAGPPSPGPDAGPVQAGPSGGPTTPYLQANPGDVEFAPVQVGAQPAREVPIRGPKQNALLDRSFEHPLVAAQEIGQRSTEQAAREREMYDAQAEHYQEQEAAMMRVQARRQQELQHLRDSYLQTIDRLSTMKVDSGRVWNNASTMDKIGATLLVMLGSFGGSGTNLPLQSVMGKINDDVENQKRAYDLGLNLAKGQQTAYAMAMDQYGSEDAAYHAAMAAGQQAVAAKIAGMGAQWKGTEAQNKAQALQGEILSAADQNRAAGLRYLQPTPGATKYQMMIRGQRVPGLVSEDKAQGYTVEHGVKPAERVDEALVKGGIDQSTEAMKLQAQNEKAQKQHAVVLPNGEILYAQNDKQAEKAQTLATAVSNANDLVQEAKRIRSGSGWMTPYSKEQKRLESIQSELTLAFKDRGGLGALSGPDMDLALSATGDITSRSPNADAKLDSFANHTSGALRNFVKTIPGAPPKSSGVMPSGFQPAKEGK